MMHEGMMGEAGWWMMACMGIFGSLLAAFLITGTVFFVRNSRRGGTDEQLRVKT